MRHWHGKESQGSSEEKLLGHPKASGLSRALGLTLLKGLLFLVIDHKDTWMGQEPN